VINGIQFSQPVAQYFDRMSGIVSYPLFRYASRRKRVTVPTPFGKLSNGEAGQVM
jgi:hypothetical protein